MRRRALLQANGEIDYSKRYLTFTALESGTFSLRVPSGMSNHIRNVSYSTDNGATWTNRYISTAAKTITTPTIAVGGKVLWKANANALASSPSNVCHFEATGNFDVSGNILSLEYGDDFADKTSLKDYGYSMCRLFYENTKIKSAENLVLPATSLKIQCYYYMFYGCTSLTKAPELPATTLADYCYYYMFSGCTSLTTAPELPATTLADYCYYYMFYNCTSLTTAPALPATTLASNCYQQMFCSCTSLTTAPELPAETLVSNCYKYMFYGCSKLNYIKCLATDTTASSCTDEWVRGVAATGTFVKNSSATWTTTGVNGVPSGWTVETASS